MSNSKVPDENVFSKLNIDKQAAKDGGDNKPPSDQTFLSTTEVGIKGIIQRFYYKNFPESEMQDIEKRILTNQEYRNRDGHDGQIAKLKFQIENTLASIKFSVKNKHDANKKAKTNLHNFKIENDIGRDSVIKSNSSRIRIVVVLVAMFLIESFANMLLLFTAIPGGIQGALALASVISFVNLSTSFLAGWMVITHLFSKQKVWLNCIIFAVYFLLIVYINFAMGVFRGISNKVQTTFTDEQLIDAASASVWPFNDWGHLGIESIGLIVLGLTFALIAVIEGYRIDDPFPGYGAIAREDAKKKNEYDVEVKNSTKELRSTSDNGIQKIENFKEERDQANKAWSQAINDVQRSFDSYERWVKGLIASGNIQLGKYRATNAKHRTIPAPAYFSDKYDFELEKEAIKAFANLKEEHITDMEKDRQFFESRKIILDEYNKATQQLTEIYSKTDSEYQTFLQELI